MSEIKKINDVRVPIRYELVDVIKKKAIRKGKETHLYSFRVRVNDARLFGNARKEVYADNLKELKMHIIRFWF